MSRSVQLSAPHFRRVEDVECALQDYAVVNYDRDGKIVKWNAGAERIFGYTQAEIMGQPIELLFTPEDRAANIREDSMRCAARTGMADVQRWHVRKDGSRVWVSGTVRALRSNRGELQGFSKIVRDMTAQKLEQTRVLDQERCAREQAEQRWKGLEDIFENIPAFVSLIRLPEQSYVFANRRVRELCPMDPTGRKVREAHPRISPVFFDIVDWVAETGRTYSATEWHIPLRAGYETVERPYLDLVLQPMRSKTGTYEAILMFATDVTSLVHARQHAEHLTTHLALKKERLEKEVAERKRTEDLAREQAALLDLAQDCIISEMLDGTIQFWNRGAEQAYGWTREQALGRKMHELLHTEFPAPREEIIRELLARGEWSGELKHTAKDGRVLEDLSRWVLQTENGVPHGLLRIDREISERKRMESRMRENQKLESLGVLAGGVAHDFNNLLMGMLGNIGLVLETTEPGSRAQELLQRAEVAGHRAADLIKQMLAYAGKGQLTVGPLDLSQIVRNAVSLIGWSIRDEIRMEYDLAEGLPPVRADSTQLQQVAINLILNAVEAIEKGPGRVHVSTSLREIDRSAAEEPYDVGPPEPGLFVALDVRDSGAGIDPAIRPRIFDPFFSTKFTGRGLGLAAVAGIVRILHGAVRVDSTPAKGTAVTVIFPAGSPS